MAASVAIKSYFRIAKIREIKEEIGQPFSERACGEVTQTGVMSGAKENVRIWGVIRVIKGVLTGVC